MHAKTIYLVSECLGDCFLVTVFSVCPKMIILVVEETFFVSFQHSFLQNCFVFSGELGKDKKDKKLKKRKREGEEKKTKKERKINIDDADL